jgi:translation initiation factor 1 (eIF-1/SUI1)
MTKPRHLYNATAVDVDVVEDGEALAITFQTDGAIDLTVVLQGDHAKRLRDRIASLSTSPSQGTERP